MYPVIVSGLIMKLPAVLVAFIVLCHSAEAGRQIVQNIESNNGSAISITKTSTIFFNRYKVPYNNS